MAGDWIKMRSNLWDDPRVAKICDLTGHAEAAVIGGLYWLWAMADQHSVDGALPGMTVRQIDRKTGVSGLGDALLVVGWLVMRGDDLCIPAFDEHNGASAKKRAQTARRVAKSKLANNDNSHTGNAAGAESVSEVFESLTQDAQSGNAQVTQQALPREREREDIRGCKHPPAQAPAAAVAQAALSPPCGNGLPPCPAEALVSLYHEVLPELPRCRVTTDARARALRRRWRWVLSTRKPDGQPRAVTAADALAWFRAFFERARASDWLMGRSPRGAGHEGWQCDLDFLLGDKGLKAVVEKTEVPA